MKALMVFLCLLFFAGCKTDSVAVEQAQPLDQPQAISYLIEDRLINYYAKRPYAGLDPDSLFAIARDVRGFASMLCIEGETDTILALINEESHFKVSIVGDDGKSKGLGQTLTKRIKHWRAFWLARGVKLGHFDSPTTQVAFCVAEFKEKLGYSRGNVKEAVRRYNGRGAGARRHANKVARARAEIFFRPLDKNEMVDYGACQ